MPEAAAMSSMDVRGVAGAGEGAGGAAQDRFLARCPRQRTGGQGGLDHVAEA